jgi:hypothetical protein
MKKQLLLGISILVIILMCIGSVAAELGQAPVMKYSLTAVGPQTSLSDSASLQPFATESGKVTLSVDGLGIDSSSGTIQVEKPAGATVRKAYLASASTGFSGYKIPDGDVKIDGTGVTWNLQKDYANSIQSYNYLADVTDIVKTKIDAAPAGRVDFTIDETGAVEGEILAVIFDDPAKTSDNTVVLFFGAQNVNGDSFNIGLADPVDLTDPDFGLDFSLGISYGWQGTSQYSIIDVNGKRLTTSAGGYDDGQEANGALLTVGGLDDSTVNPADPYALPNGDSRYDDELYTLLPFVADGDTVIKVDTSNPSNDDNIYFAALNARSATAISGEGILLSPVNAENPIHTQHTVTAKVQDDNGAAVPGKAVTITVISGPNAGVTGNGVTNNNGECSLTYTGNVVGTDVIEATFVDSAGKTITSNQATKKWIDSVVPAPEFPTVFVPVGLIGLIGLFIIASRRW